MAASVATCGCVRCCVQCCVPGWQRRHRPPMVEAAVMPLVLSAPWWYCRIAVRCGRTIFFLFSSVVCGAVQPLHQICSCLGRDRRFRAWTPPSAAGIGAARATVCHSRARSWLPGPAMADLGGYILCAGMGPSLNSTLGPEFTFEQPNHAYSLRAHPCASFNLFFCARAQNCFQFIFGAQCGLRAEHGQLNRCHALQAMPC
jgi:hypothetical protein